MDLTIDDRARLIALMRHWTAMARAAQRAGFIVVASEDIADYLEWGEDMLRRLEALDEVQS